MKEPKDKARAERANKKHDLIRAEYDAMYADGYRNNVIFPKLAEKYFLAQTTIEAIVYRTAHYHQGKNKKGIDNQLDLFGQ